MKYTLESRKILRILNYKSAAIRTKRLNRKIYNSSSNSIKQLINNIDYSLITTLVRSGYAANTIEALSFIKSGYLFLNGRKVNNPYLELHKGDFIEVLLNAYMFNRHYYIKYIKNRYLKRLRYKKWRSWRIGRRLVDPVKNFNSLKWSYLFSSLSSLGSLEVDYLSCSYFVLNKVNIYMNQSSYSRMACPIYIYKLLNWHYTN